MNMTTPPIRLRAYQSEAIEAIYTYFRRKTGGHPLVCMPTGSGKSMVIAAFIKRALTEWPSTRILVVTHVKELVSQNYSTLLEYWPEAPAGVYSAGLNKRQDTQVLFAGIQSLYKRAASFAPWDLILVDEAHLVPKSGEGMYRQLMKVAKGNNPRVKFVGFTATPFRLRSGLLTEGKDRLFDSVAYNVTLPRLIDEDWLSPLISVAQKTQIDTSKVSTVAGEYHLGQLADASIDVTQAAVDSIVRDGADRKRWLVFCVSVSHARATLACLRMAGISAEIVTGDTPAAERDKIVALYREGAIRALVNCSVFTTGFDVPDVDLIALLRPTQSTALYAQMLGRGMRLAEGKKDALVLDFGGNIERHGPVDKVRAKPGKQKPGEGEAVRKTCLNCLAEVFGGVRVCPECDYVFGYEPERGLTYWSSAAPVISKPEAPRWETITRVTYWRHKKQGKPDSIKVDYARGYTSVVCEWICLEHGGFATQKAYDWWEQRDPEGFPPLTTDVALQQTERLRTPVAVKVRPDGDYLRITDYKWAAEEGDENGSPIHKSNEGRQRAGARG